MRLRTAAVLAVAGALVFGSVTPAVAAAPPGPAAWSPDLATGEAAGITVAADGAHLDPASAHVAPSDSDGNPVPTGLLTLATHQLETPTDRVESAVDGDIPAGATATVDIRGRRANGAWTEWIPAGTAATATLPEPTTEVQGRLVLTADPGADPTVRSLTLTAHPAEPRARTEGAADAQALHYRVFATREGLVGGTTANGHQIAERDHFVALPSRRALSPRGTSDYSVKVCAPNGRCAFAPVWDVGPWNTRDDYWNPAPLRQEWTDLPQGMPQAQAAHLDDYNGGRDQYDRDVLNPAGIDLGDGLFWDALGLVDNAWVSVDYLWTGSSPLSVVASDLPVDVLAAPDPAAAIVGVAADRAAVPVECVLGAGAERWLRIGLDQYLDADAVPGTGAVAACDAGPDVAARPRSGTGSVEAPDSVVS